MKKSHALSPHIWPLPHARFFAIFLMVWASLAIVTPSGAQTPSQDASSTAQPVQTIWQLLDYIAVDYPGAVADGAVLNAFEYGEMSEFAASVEKRLADLAPSEAQSSLIEEAERLRNAVALKADPSVVSHIARALADDLLRAYPITLAPSHTPDKKLGARLYEQQCAACHGLTGRGDGLAAQGLEPQPIDFTDRARARERSLFSLYQVIGQGVDGTSMNGFSDLSSDERWALAFYVGGLSFDSTEARQGAQLWKNDPKFQEVFPDLEALTRATISSLAETYNDDEATALIAYLRHNPDALTVSAESILETAKTRLVQSRVAYQAGDAERASDLAISAYLDGFEPIEPAMAVRDADLMRKIETNMVDLRNLIKQEAPLEVVAMRIDQITALLDRAENILAASETSPGASFIGALTILLREGLEALLIVVAMIAFLRKAKRPEVLPYVHGGWIGALIFGVLTWIAANTIISIGGASRELTEGLGALIAAIVLVSVGIWMHGKSHAGAWQQYIHEKMSKALSRQSAWFMFFLAFLVVYREAFETILFFIALWSQGNHPAMLAGIGVAIFILGVAAWGLLRFSRRLPIGQFFAYSAILIAVLAVVLTGQGVAALQEAGWFSISPVAGFPRIDLLGIYPTIEGLSAQILVITILIIAFWMNNNKVSAKQA